MNIQICGQITGRDYDEAAAEFREAEHDLREQYPQAFVYNPCYHVPPSSTHERAMRACLQHLTCFADLLVVLPGWWLSKGARIEVAVAQAVGVEVRELGEVV